MPRPLYVSIRVGLAACSKGSPSESPAARIAAQKGFFGRILSMDARNSTFEAVAVDARGVVVGTGARGENGCDGGQQAGTGAT